MQKWDIVELPDGRVIQYLSASVVRPLIGGWELAMTVLVGDEITTVRLRIPVDDDADT